MSDTATVSDTTLAPVVDAKPAYQITLTKAGLVGFSVFALCLFGILTRPGTDLASFWPANAFLLGMLIRFKSLDTLETWIAAAAGYIAADLATGSTFLPAIILNGGNLATVAVGYLILSRFDHHDQRLRQPRSVVLLLVAVAAASVTAGLIGTVAGPFLFGGTPIEALIYWAVTEAVNYIAFLPVVLTIPDFRRFDDRKKLIPNEFQLLAAFALIASGAGSLLIGGPGAIAFPVPALLACALVFGVFPVACLTFLFGAWTLLAVAGGYIDLATSEADQGFLTSIRLGVALIGLAPIVTASVMSSRNDMEARLRELAERDQLSGLLNRATLLEQGGGMLNAVSRKLPISVLMFDLDHFKSINDSHGHAAGDVVISTFGRILRSKLRPADIAGRLGGEEFAVLLPNTDATTAYAIAERIVKSLRETGFVLDGRALCATVSAGVATSDHLSGASLSDLLSAADNALYAAKKAGRNRAVLSPITEMTLT